MTDAYEDGNPQVEGQPVDNVGQDEGQNVEESSGQSWEEQAKYFQSEKDKLSNENQNLKKFEAIGNLLKSRPDIANTVASMVQGGNNGQPVGPQRIELEKDDFDPWEAYNDPKSKSANRLAVDRLKDAVSLESEKLRLSSQSQKGQKESQKEKE